MKKLFTAVIVIIAIAFIGKHPWVIFVGFFLGLGFVAFKFGKASGSFTKAAETPSSLPSSVPSSENVTVTWESDAPVSISEKLSTPSIDGTGESLLYDKVGLYRPSGACGPMPGINKFLFFQLDPANPYDVDAIRAVYFDNDNQLQIAGYMNRTKLREMVRDWIDRDDEIDCWVESNDPKLEVKIQFYR